MDQILSTVGELLLKAVPTIILFVFLYFFLKSMLFTPLAKVLAEREAKTAGAREGAAASLKLADEKNAAFENALREAKGELYKEQEATRKEWIEEQSDHLRIAKAKAEEMIGKALAELALEAGAAKAGLAAQTGELADHIAKSLLEERA
jgi:F-type H+-transporting ATPase subunit b